MKTTYEFLPMHSFPLRIKKYVYHNPTAYIHWHEEIELLYFISGEGTVFCKYQNLKIKKGDIVLMNGNEPHSGCFDGDEIVYYCIQINTNFFHNLIGREYVVFKNLIEDPRCAGLLDRILEHTSQDGFRETMKVKRALFDFLSVITENYVESVLNEEEYKRSFKRLDTFNSILEYIHLHYDNDLSVQELANRFFISPSYFAHFFKGRTGKSVMEYINDIRLQHAKRFLEVENISIGEVARRVGFRDANYFSRRFKLYTKMTPVQYKQQFANQNRYAWSESNSLVCYETNW